MTSYQVFSVLDDVINDKNLTYYIPFESLFDSEFGDLFEKVLEILVDFSGWKRQNWHGDVGVFDARRLRHDFGRCAQRVWRQALRQG